LPFSHDRRATGLNTLSETQYHRTRPENMSENEQPDCIHIDAKAGIPAMSVKDMADAFGTGGFHSPNPALQPSREGLFKRYG